MKRIEYPAVGADLYEEILPNGLTLMVVPRPGFAASIAMFATRYGGADRRFRYNGEWIDTPAGVAHFLEHKMFDMPDGSNVMARFAALGADPNAYTGGDRTAYHFTGTENFADNLRTLLTYVSTPYYTEESVQKELGIIGQEIRMTEDRAGFVGYYGLMKALYARHTAGENIIGTAESIAEITPETLYRCHKVFYNPSNMLLVCVGDVDAEEISAICREILPAEGGEVPERDYGEAEDAFPAVPYSEREMELSAPQFFLGVKLPPLPRGRDRLRQKLLGELALECLLGEASPFYSELYVKGLLNRSFSYEVDGCADTMTVLLAGESRDPKAVADALTEHVSRIAANGLDEARFERCRRARYGQELAALDDFRHLSDSMVQGWVDGGNALDVFSLLEEFTADDAAAFLCEHLTKEKSAMLVLTPRTGDGKEENADA